MQMLGTEVEWELGEALPAIEGSLQRRHVDEQLKSAARISEHAATNLNPERPRWKERPPIISRLITAYDRLRDFPWGAVRSR